MDHLQCVSQMVSYVIPSRGIIITIIRVARIELVHHIGPQLRLTGKQGQAFEKRPDRRIFVRIGPRIGRDGQEAPDPYEWNRVSQGRNGRFRLGRD